MRKYVGNGFKRIIVMNFERGEKLLDGIIKACEEEGIKNGVLLGAIGSLQKVHLHRVMGFDAEPKDEFIIMDSPFEISAAQGVIVDGKPHFHFVVSDLKQAYTGHLEPETEVLYLVEATVAEFDDLQLDRKIEENNIARIVRK
jgi:predicted DNA-binding protein with PD1-like motif